MRLGQTRSVAGSTSTGKDGSDRRQQPQQKENQHTKEKEQQEQSEREEEQKYQLQHQMELAAVNAHHLGGGSETGAAVALSFGGDVSTEERLAVLMSGFMEPSLLRWLKRLRLQRCAEALAEECSALADLAAMDGGVDEVRALAVRIGLKPLEVGRFCKAVAVLRADPGIFVDDTEVK